MSPGSHPAPAKAPPPKNGAKAVAITLAKVAGAAALAGALAYLHGKFPAFFPQ